MLCLPKYDTSDKKICFPLARSTKLTNISEYETFIKIILSIVETRKNTYSARKAFKNDIFNTRKSSFPRANVCERKYTLQNCISLFQGNVR